MSSKAKCQVSAFGDRNARIFDNIVLFVMFKKRQIMLFVGILIKYVKICDICNITRKLPNYAKIA